MPAPHSYDYALIRAVPRVERGEFVNVGVILSCPGHEFLAAGICIDRARLAALDPQLDIDALEQHLRSIPVLCAGGAAAQALGKLSQRERFHWLVAPRSAMIQTSPVHTGRCENPQATLELLMRTMVAL